MKNTKILIFILTTLLLVTLVSAVDVEVYDSLQNESVSDGIPEDEDIFGLYGAASLRNLSLGLLIKTAPNATISTIGLNITNSKFNNTWGNITICRNVTFDGFPFTPEEEDIGCTEQTIVKSHFNYSEYITGTGIQDIPLDIDYLMNDSWVYILYLNIYSNNTGVGTNADYRWRIAADKPGAIQPYLLRISNSTQDGKKISSLQSIVHIKLYEDVTYYNVSVAVDDLWDGSQILNFTSTLDGISKNTDTGVTNHDTENGTYTLTLTDVNNDTFFDRTYSVTVAGNTTINVSSFQNELNVWARTTATNNSVSIYNSSIGSQSNQSSSNWTVYYPHSGTITLTGNKSGFYPSNNETLVLNSKTNYSTYLYFPWTLVNVSVQELIINKTIPRFNLTINSSENKLWTQNLNSSIGWVHAYLSNGTFSFRVQAGNYSNQTHTLTLNKPAYNLTVNLSFIGSSYIQIFNEETEQLLIKNVSIEFISTDFAQNYSTQNGTLFIGSLIPGSYEIVCSSNNYATRRFYTTLTTTGSITANLYLLNSTIGTAVLVKVIDQNNEAVETATVQMLRYYISTNTYKTVAMTRTDYLGYGQLDIELGNPKYQFIVQSGGITRLTTIGTPIWNSNTIEFNINTIEDFLYSLQNIDNVYTTLWFNNVTGNFVYTFSDNLGLLRQGCLKVTSRGTRGDTIICNTCINSSAGTATCFANTSDTLYIAVAYIDTTTNFSLHIRETLSYFISSGVDVFGKQGVFYSFMIISVFALLGIWNPVAAIVMGLFGTLLSVWLGFLSFGTATYTILIGILFVGFLAIIKMKS